MHFFTFIAVLIAATLGYLIGKPTDSKSKQKAFIVVMPGDPAYTVVTTYFTKKELEKTNVIVHAEVTNIGLAEQFCKYLNSNPN